MKSKDIFTVMVILCHIMICSPAFAEVEKVSSKDGALMILIPKGGFIYGLSREELDKVFRILYGNNSKAWELGFNLGKFEITDKQNRYLSDYYIDKYDVTNKQYAKFVKETGHRKPNSPEFNHPDKPDKLEFNHPDQPVTGVGYKDAEAYCKWAGKRLPTEEEWEKAARGTDGRWWPWANSTQPDICNTWKQNAKLAKVGEFNKCASPYGVMDMCGGLWQMVNGIDDSVWGKYIMRGGSWVTAQEISRTTVRWSPGDKENGARWLGFRCVQDAD